MHAVPVKARRGIMSPRTRVSRHLRAAQYVCCPVCVLGTKHWSCTRTASALNPASSLAPKSFFFYLKSEMDFLCHLERNAGVPAWPPLTCSLALFMPPLLSELSSTSAFVGLPSAPSTSHAQLPQGIQRLLHCVLPGWHLCISGVQHHFTSSERLWHVFLLSNITLSPGPHPNFSYTVCIHF